MEWSDPHIHQSFAFISDQDVLKFAYLTGDLNTVHLDNSVAQQLGFERAICHGMLVASYISSALTEYFGLGTIYINQNTKFIKPVLVNSEIIIKLQNPIINQKGRTEVQSNVWAQTKNRKGGENFLVQNLAIIGRAEIIPGKKNFTYT